MTLFGAISLGLLAILPIIAEVFIGNSVAIGGTSVLILVAVSLETLRAVESRALMVTYDQYARDDFFYDDLSGDDGEKTTKRAKILQQLPFIGKKNSPKKGKK